MTFERDTTKDIVLNPTPGAIKDGSPVYIWGYPLEYAPDGFEKSDRDELTIQLENPNRLNTRVCICAGPGFAFPGWVMSEKWEMCNINVSINPNRKSLYIIDMDKLQPNTSDVRQEDDFDDDGSDAIFENVILREDNEKLKSKIQYFTEKNSHLLKENNDLLQDKSTMIKKEIQTQVKIDELEKENAALHELARKLSAKNCTVFKRARRKLKKIFCASSK